jgi:hypothetical protein
MMITGKPLLPWSYRHLRHILKNLTLRLVASGLSLDATQNLSVELGTSIPKTFSDYTVPKYLCLTACWPFFECLLSGISHPSTRDVWLDGL